MQFIEMVGEAKKGLHPNKKRSGRSDKKIGDSWLTVDAYFCDGNIKPNTLRTQWRLNGSKITKDKAKKILSQS